MESPSACSDTGAAPQHSGAKRSRAEKASSVIEFDAEELKEALGVDDDYMVLGIDESGRGPVIGPMVYTGAMITLREHAQLIELCHVADSKVLDDAHRRAARAKMGELKTLQLFTVALSADDVAAAMTGRHGKNLNTLSHDTAMEIIRQATLAGLGKLCAVYVDTVGPPETYQSKLSARFPFLRVVVSKRADSKFPVVSAASIEAKVSRDVEVEGYGQDVGSGYPSDPKAGPWLRSHLHRLFVFPRRYGYVRQSWGPVVQLAKDPAVCIPVTFEQDEENEKSSSSSGGHGDRRGGAAAGKQRRLTFAPPPPRRAAVFTHMLRLRSVADLEEDDWVV